MKFGPNIITDGLVLALDAANPKSYPGTGTTWKDLSGDGNNGTLTNGPTFDSANKGSIVFDSVNDYTSIPHNSNLNPETGDFTFSAWVKYNGAALTTTSVIETLISKGIYNVSGGEWEVIFRGGSINGFYFRVRTSTGFDDINLSSDQRSIIEDGNFHMITISIEKGAASEGKAYLDGNLVGTKSTVTTNINNTAPLYIAKYSTIYGAIKVGSVFIYKNKALSEDEILQNYNALKSRFK
ncbi:LamG domain-containing protein [bacterium]|nr:LamG domain-containing protein [bacterium]